MDDVTSFVNVYAHQLLLGAAVAVFVGVVGYTLHKAKKVPGEEHMSKENYLLSKRQQRRQESSLVSDGIEAHLLDMFSKGQLTEERYNAWRLRISKRVGLLDMQNKAIVLTPAQKKDNAKAFLEQLKKQPKPKLVKEKAKPKNVVDAILNGV